MVSIYVLKDPSTSEVRYVGQTRDPLSRLKSHCFGDDKNIQKDAWVDELKLNGQTPVMEVVDTVTVETANDSEKKWIARFINSGASLLNVSIVLPRARTYVPQKEKPAAKTSSDKRLLNRGVPGNKGGGRPAKRKTLLIDGVLQDGHYQLVAITSETIVLQTINAGHAPGKE